MNILLLYIILGVIDRIFSIQFFEFSISSIDLLLILLPISLFRLRVAPVYFYSALALSMFVLLHIVVNELTVGFNTMISMPLRVLAVGIIVKIAQDEVFDPLSMKCAYILFFSSILIQLFLTTPPSTIDFNRNEISIYSFAILFVILGYKIFHDIPLNKYDIIVLPFLLIFSLWFVDSRQGILAYTITIAISCLWLPVNKIQRSFCLLGVVILFLGYVSGALNSSWLQDLKESIYHKSDYIVSGSGIIPKGPISKGQETVANLRGERESYKLRRLEAVKAFTPKTRADKRRYRNLIFILSKSRETIFLGYGPRGFIRNGPNGKSAHSTFFSTFHNFGGIGLLLLIGLLAWIMRQSVTSVLSKNVRIELNFGTIFFAILPIALITSAFFIELLGKGPIYIFLIVALLLRDKNIRQTNERH